MPNYVRGLNPKILIWARERAGYSLDEVASHFNKDVTEIAMWETGDRAPTFPQLETLAETLYKRPTALFFFPYPPDEPEVNRSFRTLPESEVNKLQPDTLHAIRQARAMQVSLRELTGGFNPSEHLIFRDLKINNMDNFQAAAKSVREYLGIPLQKQWSWRSDDTALDVWRDAIQKNGIFVFKRSFKQKDISGFCLVDTEFPVIYLNNSTAKTRQIFTLFHELAHILLGANGITKQDDRYIKHLDYDLRMTEVFCNKFAGEFLVPASEFNQEVSHVTLSTTDAIENFSEKLSKRYKVSREVILRKLLDRQKITQSTYNELSKKWIEEYEHHKLQKKQTKKSGGNQNATEAIYLGTKFLHLAFTHYYQGKSSLEELAGYLGVKALRIPEIEHFFLKKASSS